MYAIRFTDNKGLFCAICKICTLQAFNAHFSREICSDKWDTFENSLHGLLVSIPGFLEVSKDQIRWFCKYFKLQNLRYKYIFLKYCRPTVLTNTATRKKGYGSSARWLHS